MVSIIIPCFNVEQYIEKCLESVYSQKIKNLQVICVDNNSIDNSLNVLKDLKRNKFQNLIILQEKKKGASAARNLGLKYAKSDWIQFLDADDTIMPHKLSHQLSILNSANTIPSFISASSLSINEQRIKKINKIDHKQSIWLSLFEGRLGNTCSNLWNKNAVFEAGGWNEELLSSQETELMFRIMKNNSKIIFDNKPLTRIYLTNNVDRISNQNKSSNAIRFFELRLQILDWLFKNEPDLIRKNSEGFAKSLMNAYYSEKIYKKFRVRSLLKPYKFWLLKQILVKDWITFQIKHLFI